MASSFALIAPLACAHEALLPAQGCSGLRERQVPQLRIQSEGRVIVSSRLSGSAQAAASVAFFALATGRCRQPRRVARVSRKAVGQAVALPDGRRYRVLGDDVAVGEYIRARVQELAASAIAAKGAFSLSIGSGTTVAPLRHLQGIDFSKVHIFFGNDRTEGDTAGKCFKGAMAFVEACGIPLDNVHPIGEGDPAAAAERYEAVLRSMPPEVVGRCERNGLPALDLILLGTGADGHTASLYPDSAQVLQSPGDRLIVPAEGKGGVTASLDYICSARQVILSAAKDSQAQMVSTALLSGAAAASNTKCPAGMVAAAPGTEVEWLLAPGSAPTTGC